jgi:hypothetical protein
LILVLLEAKQRIPRRVEKRRQQDERDDHVGPALYHKRAIAVLYVSFVTDRVIGILGGGEPPKLLQAGASGWRAHAEVDGHCESREEGRSNHGTLNAVPFSVGRSVDTQRHNVDRVARWVGCEMCAAITVSGVIDSPQDSASAPALQRSAAPTV